MWVEQNRIEPLLPFPRPAVDTWYERWGEPYPPDLCLSIDAYWQIATRLPSHIDYLFFAPWFNTGGGDSVLLEYLRAVQRADPMATVALITTENAESRRIRELPPEVHVVELREFLGQGVPRSAFVDWIIPQVIAQKRVRTVHAFNSTIAYDVVERWGRELDAICNIFLSTFSFDRTEDGERTSVLFLRRPDFLAPVRAVLVDSQHFAHAAVAELGYPAEKFAVQRSVVDLPVDSARLGADSRTDALRVLWAGRFDLAKRLDIFADIVAESRARKLPFEFHFYGEPVMADAAIDKVLAELEAYGAHRHPPYERFAELPLSRFGAYILTSEWEGVPLSLLEAMGCGIPSVAADVGGVNEVLDNTTGYPVADFRDVGSYVDRLEEIWAEPELARARSAAAMKRVRDRHTPRAFDASLAEIAGYLRDPATMSSPTTATNELHE
ncbi:MAG: hypothetical protein ABS64_02970 [Microbacterium sp. SCN 69-37]|nr:MAG: hypothetical protein ABS64_02970 [Microbacterium sp. SCN 69-37]